MDKKILLSAPNLNGMELSFIKEALDSNWVAPLGRNVELFEREIANYIGQNYAVALSSGTAAIHLALKALGVGANDIVFCSSYTFCASCNPILYCNAIPVFIDSEYQSYNMSAAALERAYKKYPNPKAIIIVNLYGNPADFNSLLSVAKVHNTPVIEDAAESLGSTYNGVQTGNFGVISVFSFNGNKIITTSGGGMAVTKDKKIRDKMFFWATQAREDLPWYEHRELGYNYRLSNICAGIGRGQLLTLDGKIAKKREIYCAYRDLFDKNPLIEMIPQPQWCECNHWLSAITLSKECKTSFMDIVQLLAQNNIECRPSWKPMHLQPLYQGYDFFSHSENICVCEDLYNRSVCLPSDCSLTSAQIERVAKIVDKKVRCDNNIVDIKG